MGVPVNGSAVKQLRGCDQQITDPVEETAARASPTTPLPNGQVSMAGSDGKTTELYNLSTAI